MSLLARISEQSGARAVGQQETMAAREQEKGKPDAEAQSADERANYSAAVASAPEQELADEAPEEGEQEMFTEVERALAETVYGEAASDSILSVVTSAQDPVQGVATAASDVTSQMIEKYPEMTEDVAMEAGISAVEMIADLYGSSAGSGALSEDQLAEAFSIAVNIFMDDNKDMQDPAMMQYMAEEAPEALNASMSVNPTSAQKATAQANNAAPIEQIQQKV